MGPKREEEEKLNEGLVLELGVTVDSELSDL
jgi:hypothetical protein